MFELLVIIVLAYVWYKIMGSMMKSTKESAERDFSKPMNPNGTPACPPHKWIESDIKGVVYECKNCGYGYPQQCKVR